ncbi:MAG: winged helix-turn-helix transcriptional regulator [Candidatus Marinimicrobia bacterium]|nr:winged helix-turn-helix transcriptional regulator [Candidatus Neomarinimicrobiota bacterium]
MLTKYPRIPLIASNIQLFAEIINNIYSQIFLNDICPVNISKNQLKILTTLFISDDKTASAISDILRVSRPAITQQVDKLLKLNLVSRETDSVDRRSVNISLTKRGQDIVNTYEEYILARHANVLNYFTYEERDCFNNGLEKFIDLCLENEDNLEILCLNCEGHLKKFCKIQHHKHICHLNQKQTLAQ